MTSRNPQIAEKAAALKQLVAGKNSVKAKDLSKWGIVIGTVLVVILSGLRAIWPLVSEKTFGLTQTDILMIGGFCVVAWSPVYVSMWIEKFTGSQKESPCVPENSYR